MDILGIALNADCELVVVYDGGSSMLTMEKIGAMLENEELEDDVESALSKVHARMQDVLDEGTIDELQEIEVPEDFVVSEDDEFSFDEDSELGDSGDFVGYDEDDKFGRDLDGFVL